MKKEKKTQLIRKLAHSVADKTGEKVYIPSSTERKLLEAMADPENRTLTITELCYRAGVNRVSYYAALKRPGFAALVRELTVGIFLGSAAQVASAVVKQAVRGEYKQQELVLKQAGIIRDQPTINAGNITLAWGGKPVTPVKESPEE